jgi:hypothetical protein
MPDIVLTQLIKNITYDCCLQSDKAKSSKVISMSSAVCR